MTDEPIYTSMEDRQEDPDVWTDFETGFGTSEDGQPVWGAYCPQSGCEELNTFKGDPARFANRAYACSACGWVSLMDESVEQEAGP